MPLDAAERERVVDEALAAGAREALLTGGEPLLAADVFALAARLRAGGARVMLATNGMRLAVHAAEVAGLFHEVYLSLDGPDASTHDGLRGAAAFDRLAEGIAALRARSPRPIVVARSVVHALSVDRFAETIEAARRLGADHVSFLALDAHSEAFGGRAEHRARLVPTAEQVQCLRATIDRLEAAGSLGDGFVLEDAPKLHALARHLDASGGRARFARPRCDAPRWSSVVTAEGTLRPCFFHPPVGDVRAGLAAIRSSRAYREAEARIRRPNAACERCVCPKWRPSAWRRRLARWLP